MAGSRSAIRAPMSPRPRRRPKPGASSCTARGRGAPWRGGGRRARPGMGADRLLARQSTDQAAHRHARQTGVDNSRDRRRCRRIQQARSGSAARRLDAAPPTAARHHQHRFASRRTVSTGGGPPAHLRHLPDRRPAATDSRHDAVDGRNENPSATWDQVAELRRNWDGRSSSRGSCRQTTPAPPSPAVQTDLRVEPRRPPVRLQPATIEVLPPIVEAVGDVPP